MASADLQMILRADERTHRLLNLILKELKMISAQHQALLTALTGIQADIAPIAGDINVLQQQLADIQAKQTANGEPEDLTDVVTLANSIKSNLDNVVTGINNAATPPAATGTQPTNPDVSPTPTPTPTPAPGVDPNAGQ